MEPVESLSKKTKRERKKKRKSEEGSTPDVFCNATVSESHSCRKKRKKEKYSSEEIEEGNSPSNKKIKFSDSKTSKKCQDTDREVVECVADVWTGNYTGTESTIPQSNSEPSNSGKSKMKKGKKKKKNDMDSPLNVSSKDSCAKDVQTYTVEDMENDTKTTKKKKMKKQKKEKERGDSSARLDEIKPDESSRINKNEIGSQNDFASKKKKKKKRQKMVNEKEESGIHSNKRLMNVPIDTHATSNTEDTIKSKKRKKKSKKEEDSDLTNEVLKSTNKTLTQLSSSKISTSDKEGMGEGEGRKTERKNTSAKVGQWGTASFENDKQQEKFLRLLGGFKAGSKLGGKTNIFEKFTEASDSSSDKSTVNCAMNKREEEKYNRNMENQYEKAMSMNLNRGVGLGFDATSIGKKFHIDKFQSKSLKFDD